MAPPNNYTSTVSYQTDPFAYDLNLPTLQDTKYVDSISSNGNNLNNSISQTIDESDNGFVKLDSVKDFFDEVRKHRMHLSTLVIWFFVFFILTFIVLYAWKPDGVQKYNKRGNPTGEVDAWKVVAASAVIAAIFTLIIFVLFGW